jgi:diguanylate cyclase (GGDEF)-like protein
MKKKAKRPLPPNPAAQLRQENRRLRDLLEAARLVLSTFELNTALDAILKSAQELTRCSAASIALYDPEAKELNLFAQRGLDEHQIAKHRWAPQAGGLSDRVLRERRLMVVSQRTNRSFLRDPARVNERIKTMVCVPLVFDGRPLGILYVSDFAPRDYSQTEQRALSILASFAATAIDRVKLHRLTQELARTDGLTGLFNHRFFQDQLAHEAARAERYRRPLSLVMLDVDNFKQINDRYGHPAGDAVLRHSGVLLRALVRECDVPARYGGEEFAILLPETAPDHALLVAERIQRSFAKAKPEQFGLPRRRHVGVSVGVASYPRDAKDRVELVRKADKALYTAKARGKNRVVQYTAGG